MNTTSKIVITDIRDVPKITPQGTLAYDSMVTYSVDGTRVYQITVPKDKSNLEDIKKAITQAEQDRAKILGQSFEVR